MSQTNGVPAEFCWLGATAILMLVIVLPYVLDRIGVWGLGATLDNPKPGAPRLAEWAERMKAAHYNTVENFVVFAPVLVAVVLSGQSSPATVLAAMVFFYARLAYAIVYTFGIPVLRTLCFLVGWLATLYLALLLVGISVPLPL
jgi:uncharacterized MAPEG superfamily protein